MKTKIKIGLFGVGLNTYWTQFDGLLERLTDYQLQIKKRMERIDDVTIIDAGMVDTQEKSHAAAQQMIENDVEIVFLFISTYALSSTVLPVVRRLNVPVILLNIQPESAINYRKLNSMQDRGAMTGEWLANCQACSVPEFACVFNNASVRYDIVSGYLNDPEAWSEINGWIKAAKVSHSMRHNRMGILGNYYGGMMDVYSDLALHSSVFGTHIETVEMCELVDLREKITSEEVAEKLSEFNDVFVVDQACSPDEIERSAKTSVALDKLVERHKLGSLAYYYEGAAGNKYEDVITSIIAGNTLLTGKNIPVAGEYEVKNAQAMKILSILNAGGCFSEFYAIDYNDDIVMLGHDGPAHFALAEQKVRLVPLPLYHGKPGNGLSIQMSVKHGPVTILSVVENKEGISLLAAQGESVPGPIMDIGNLNSRYKFPISAKQFVESWSKAGPSHHCAIGLGHQNDILKKFAFITNIPIKIIC